MAHIRPAIDGMESSPLFPMFLKLTGRRCLIVGGCEIAFAKIQSLLVSGAVVRVVAPHASNEVEAMAGERKISWDKRLFKTEDLDGIFVAVVATDSAETNRQIYLEAQHRGVLCNVVDDPEHCDFYYPAVVRRGALQIAISTGGLSPALAQRLRRDLEHQFGAEYESWLKQLGAVRNSMFAANTNPEERRRRLHALASRAAWENFLQQKRTEQS